MGDANGLRCLSGNGRRPRDVVLGWEWDADGRSAGVEMGDATAAVLGWK